MTVVVTGASGFVGSHLVKSLAESGHKGYAVSRDAIRTALPPGWKWVRRSTLLSGGGKLGGASHPVSAEIVIHLEVKHHVFAPGARELRDIQEVNEGNTLEWLNWASARHIDRFVFFSTIKSVGGFPGCQDESCSLPPETAYGRSKRAAEEAVQWWTSQRPGRAALILRPAVIYGPGNQANLYAFLQAIEKGRFWLIGSNDNVKSIVSIQNVCAAVSHLIAELRPGCEIFNLTDCESHTVRELAELIASTLGVPFRARSMPIPLARVAAGMGDVASLLFGVNLPLTTSRLHALLEATHFSCVKLQQTGFKHPQTAAEGIRELVAWHRRASVG